eukprot:1084338-Amphidinium_carterae.1
MATLRKPFLWERLLAHPAASTPSTSAVAAPAGSSELNQRREPLGGAVHESVLYGPYGSKLQLLPAVRKAAEHGVSQKPRKKVPVALHLARVEFGGRVVTCAPPSYWPEFAAAAVAVQLTTKDKEENIFSYLTMCGGRAKIREVLGDIHRNIRLQSVCVCG